MVIIGFWSIFFLVEYIGVFFFEEFLVNCKFEFLEFVIV